ncbi:hypothetical protein CSPX01_05102, partial [Colletotrichum filicis]
VSIRFSNNKLVKLLGFIVINTLFNNITFYILLTNTPFLYYLRNINKLGVYFNNINNLLIKGDIISRFKFTLRDNYDFNYKIIINVIYLINYKGTN